MSSPRSLPSTDYPGNATSSWTAFWFCAPQPKAALAPVRIGLAVIACWYFVSHFADAGKWFAGDGLLATSRLSQFLTAANLSDDAWWRISPLYLVNSTSVLRAYLGLGIVFAVLSVVVKSSRAPAVLLWLWCVWLANRSLMISGPEELALCFGLAYLAIGSPSSATSPSPHHWTDSLALRLTQVHTLVLIGVTGLTMLSASVWWDGTGSVAAAAPIGRRTFDLTGLLSSPWLHESLTHALVFTAIVAPILLAFGKARIAAYVALMVWCAIVALLTSQWMYLATVAVLLQSIRPLASTSFELGRADRQNP
jgi:hypothetical protein